MSTTSSASGDEQHQQAPLILITGISGYIASWVGYAALQAGYRVRGTVRSLHNENKVKHLRQLNPNTPTNRVQLVEADLTSDQGWDDAVKGCDYILHLASPFPLQEPKDPNELIIPAVEGTLRVLQAAARQPVDQWPKRIVLTSSVAAVVGGHSKETFDDNDWTILDSKEHPISTYYRSKTVAELTAWEFMKNLTPSPPPGKMELATINPTLVLGPMLSSTACSSADLMKQLLCNEIPGLPDLYIQYVSVFDVARAHLLAMIHPDAAGKRFIVSSGSIAFREVADILYREFKPQGYSPTTMKVPNFILQTLAFFGDKLAKGTLPLVGKKPMIQPNNARRILGLHLNEDKRLILEMCYAAIHQGIIVDKSKGQAITKNYVQPEFDMSMIAPAIPVAATTTRL